MGGGRSRIPSLKVFSRDERDHKVDSRDLPRDDRWTFGGFLDPGPRTAGS
jgi:hypothetical protein